MTFRHEKPESGLFLWFGDPNCQAAHNSVLVELGKLNPPFYTSLPDSSTHKALKGNLGEFIARCIAQWNQPSELMPFPGSAVEPLSPHPLPGVDIVWLYFGDTPEDDYAILQEVKCTSDKSLSYSRRLIDDYDKLFGIDQNVTLRNRLNSIKNKLEFELDRKYLCSRVNDLAGVSPATCKAIHLRPTLIYELLEEVNPGPKLLAVRSTLIDKGWNKRSIRLWGVGLSELDDRLIRLAMGKQ